MYTIRLQLECFNNTKDVPLFHYILIYNISYIAYISHGVINVYHDTGHATGFDHQPDPKTV